MMISVMWLGLLAWTLVFADFVTAFARRRSSVRFVFVSMSLGWPICLLREMRHLHRNIAAVLILLGICGGLSAATILIVRWVNNPRVLD